MFTGRGDLYKLLFIYIGKENVGKDKEIACVLAKLQL